MPKKLGDLRPSERRERLEKALKGSGGLGVKALMRMFNAARRTVERDLALIRDSGVRVDESFRGPEKVYSTPWGAGEHALKVTYAELVALRVAAGMFARKFRGTGYDDDIGTGFEKIVSSMRQHDAKVDVDFDRKYFDLNEAPRRYADTADVLDALRTGLELSQRVRCVHARVGGGTTPFDFDPYSQITYKNGLYFMGKVHHSKTVEALPLEGFKEAEWQRGVRFPYPSVAEHDPATIFRMRWGIRGGERTDLLIAFTKKVSEYIERRMWHPTQETERVSDDWHLLRMSMDGTIEAFSWILSFGKQMIVIEPASLREAIIAELKEMLALYERVAAVDDLTAPAERA
jgi:predicted DNA-binding transcriptional regulator YafY